MNLSESILASGLSLDSIPSPSPFPAVETTEALVDMIAHVHTEAETTRFITLAACTLFLYDFITTIDYEVKYIWSNNWSIPRVVFHLNRVWPAIVIGLAIPAVTISSISPMVCKNIVIAYSYASIMVSLNIATVVILRCWALYDRKPWVLKFLISLLMLMVVPCAFVVKKQADDNLYLVNTLPEILPGCIVIHTPNAWIPYIFALIFESTVFSMMLHRTFIIARDYGNTPIIRRLMIDGTLYYVAAIIALIFCLCAVTAKSIRASVISSGLLVSILSVMCSRMTLSLYNFTEHERIERSGTSGHLAVGSGNLKSGLETLNWDAKAATGSLRLFIEQEDELWVEICSESKAHGFLAAEDIGVANGKFMIGNIEVWDD
ncbi:unnamed protein product [Rhizoctonia solani]|uniref:DUF6533 domain-containing protein n=1 Tax=Rhizoctonia solani TaxID=456999 RepID=A0A8H3CCF0_9AGAM|nr:unnamed protein product [Rhizoctonia solani]